MIKNLIPLSMPETTEYITGDSDKEEDVKKFVKKFTKVNAADSKKIRKKIEELDMVKIRPESIAKIIDIMPEDNESLNKIFTDVSLDEDEAKKILDTISEFK